ncbi:MAG: FHA domain-containing protein [Gammaproteobacteria bacterium]|nr:FHA domain-containing protein [Gammaproteobacteria bacterium]
MKYLIRFISRNAAGGVEHNDRIVDAPVITIGRATDQVLHLRDRRARLQHAAIEQQSDGVHITTSALSGVSVNGRSQRDARLETGDVIEVGSNVLRVIEAPGGVDFAISFELSAEASDDHFVTDWSAPATGVGGWSKRRLSWTLAVVVLLFALLLPGLSLLQPLTAVTRSTALPDDGLWLSGPVHSAHSSTAAECEACHVKPFQRVPDGACMECHAASRHVADGAATVLGEVRCASCHLEHNEPPELVKRHQGLCADCHRDLPPDAQLESAADFLDSHPAFKVNLLRPTAAPDNVTEWRTEHVLLSEARDGDRSNLIFNHAVHLDDAGIVTPDGRRVIECVECHEPEAGGASMKPISMDEHCSDCHTLSFDPDDPSRAVPHGDPDTVVQSLVEYYSARLLGADPDAVEQRVRRPGRALSRADRDRAAAEARVKALSVAEDLFERRACATCHDVTRGGDAADIPWQVAPVKLTERFFVHANFDHGAHDTEVTTCDGCHEASASESARDVLIPDIDNCRECHGSGFARRNATAQIPSTCIMCHSFHIEGKGTHE